MKLNIKILAMILLLPLSAIAYKVRDQEPYQPTKQRGHGKKSIFKSASGHRKSAQENESDRTAQELHYHHASQSPSQAKQKAAESQTTQFPASNSAAAPATSATASEITPLLSK